MSYGPPPPMSKRVFMKYDKDGGNSIDTAELGNMMYDLGHPLSQREIEGAVKILDTDGDGIISSAKLARAADLMRKDLLERGTGAAAGEGAVSHDAGMAAAHMLAEATKADIRTQVEATQRSLAEMRSENMARETRLLEELKAAEERERLLQESLISLGKTMERLTVAATRGRRQRPQANGTKAANGDLAASGGTRSDDDERMVQDGERLPNKAAPERLVQRL